MRTLLAITIVSSGVSLGCRSASQPMAYDRSNSPGARVASATALQTAVAPAIGQGPSSLGDEAAVTLPQERSPITTVGFQDPATEALLKPALPLDLPVSSPEQVPSGIPEVATEGIATAEISAPAMSDDNNSTSAITLQDVVTSVRASYPAIREAVARQDEASGSIVSAWGGFDDVLDGHTINQPLGYYENYRHGLGLKKPLWNGGYLATGYRLGDGDFEPWYGERETDEGGEFKLGLDVPLLQGRAIDKRRTELRGARLRRGQTDPELSLEILNAQAAAAVAYWGWVAAGLGVDVQQRLLELARERALQIEERIKQQDVPGFLRLDNNRLIANREIKLIEAQRKFGESAVKLSLYYRDAQGQPIVPAPAAIPGQFPDLNDAAINPDEQIAIALRSRPELQVLQFDAARVRVELEQAINQLLPELNLALETSQDVGGQTSSKGDKQPGKIEAGVYGQVPLQRRFARGKIDSLRAKLRQVDAKTQLTGDKIATEVQQILVAREASLNQIKQAEINVDLAEKTLAAGTIGLREGEFTLPVLNIYEQALADAQYALILSKAEFFVADALLSIATARELDIAPIP